MNRRRFIHHAGQAAAFSACRSASSAEPAQPSPSEEEAIRLLAEGFLREQGIKALLEIAIGARQTLYCTGIFWLA